MNGAGHLKQASFKNEGSLWSRLFPREPSLPFDAPSLKMAAINPAYRTFVEQEIARLGEDHLAIQAQYMLRPISGAHWPLTPPDLAQGLLPCLKITSALLTGTLTTLNTPAASLIRPIRLYSDEGRF